MARYRYRALQTDGQVTTGTLVAPSQEAATVQLRADGLVPIDLVERRALFSARRRAGRGAGRKPVLRDLVIFSREMAMLYDAGVPLDRSLRMLSEQSDGPMPGLAGTILGNITQGASLSEALANLPEVFPAYFVGIVRAGEAGGDLGGAFRRLHGMLEKQAVMNAKVRSALTYPVIVLALTGLSIVVLLAMVVPQFKPVFARAGDNLPMATQIIVAASDFALEWGLFVGAGLVLAGLLAWRIRLPDGLRLRRDRMALHLPAIGPMVRALEAGRFCRMLGTLRQNGVDLIDGVAIAGETLHNSAMRAAIAQLSGPLSHGEGLSKPLDAMKILPPLATELIAVGEESGKMDDMLIEAANLLDDEADTKVQSALALLVPLVTVFLGVIVAGVIGSILSAILGTYRIGL